MVIAARRSGLTVYQQKPINVFFEDNVVGNYTADLIIDDCVIVELKSVRQLIPEHEAQLLSYLKSTEIEVGLLFNFGPKAEFKRKVFDNERKGSLDWIKPKNPQADNPRPSE